MHNSEIIDIICIIGPTASGKTSLGVSLAEIFNGEVVSADSMQIYRGMSISTAKPSIGEMRGIRHHMIDFIDPSISYSVADYVLQARSVIKDIHERGKTPVLVGGTGLYINSLLDNITFVPESPDASLRNRLFETANEKGIDYMLSYLESFDPQTAHNLSEQRNLKRIVRAIEVYESTGTTISRANEESKKVPSPYCAVKIGLSCRDRQKLYDRINSRVDRMISEGLIEEARKVYLSKNFGTSVQAIGCKEMFPYFRGEKSLEECIDNLKRETRHYAKRQLTWFRRDGEINWIFSDDLNSAEDVVRLAADILIKKGYKKNGTV